MLTLKAAGQLMPNPRFHFHTQLQPVNGVAAAPGIAQRRGGRATRPAAARSAAQGDVHAAGEAKAD